MEEKKLDKNTIIGFALIFVIVLWMTFSSTKKAAQEDDAKRKLMRNQ